ncbi:MAG: hypothetical protein U9Q62_09170 [Campylobacterota bacterium]|nr:hypothetical protein [Campylobacterota bacterium]
MRRLSLSIFLFFLFTALQAASLMGKWEYNGPQGYILLDFRSSSELVYEGESMPYQIVGESIRVPGEYGYIDYPYVLEKNGLRISYPEGYQLTFKRPAKRQNQQHSGNNQTLANQIAGIWWGYAGSTEREIGLCPGGMYRDFTESGYSGNSYNSMGDATMNWGTANQSSGQGRWTIQGDTQSGVIHVRYNNGSTAALHYHQINDPGCLKFNGNTLCRKSVTCQ